MELLNDRNGLLLNGPNYGLCAIDPTDHPYPFPSMHAAHIGVPLLLCCPHCRSDLPTSSIIATQQRLLQGLLTPMPLS